MAVLVAISIPVFTSQLEKSRESTDIANVRSAYAEVVTSYLDKASATTIKVHAQQKVSNWQTQPQPVLIYQGNGAQGSYKFDAKVNDDYTVTISVDANTGAAMPNIS